MAMSVALLVTLGVVALLASTAVVVLEILNALVVRDVSSVQIAAAVSAALEGTVVVVTTFLLFMSLRHATYYGPRKLGNVWLPITLILVVAATTASTTVLVILGKETQNVEIVGIPEMSYLIGTVVAVAIAFVAQVVFIVVYFIGSKVAGTDKEQSPRVGGARFMPHMRVKSVPYSQTAATDRELKEPFPTEFQSPPSSSSGRSMAETMSSIRSSMSQITRQNDSKTRLISVKPSKSTRSIRSANSRTSKRPPSLDSINTANEGFDSWDTSAVETNHRPALDTSLPTGARFLGALETIPASPTVSRSPSPGCPLDLEPPPTRQIHRTRSYSPIPVPKPPPALTSHASASELHIHPLFRADSPTPPPAATPGTSIIAAPNGVRTVSARSLNRMRSGSLPSSSPLSRQNSYESMKGKTPSPTSDRLSPALVETVEEERKMTPPLPDWVMNAGSRSSLTEYQWRKVRERENKVDSGLGILP